MAAYRIFIIDDEPLISHALRIVIEAEADMEVAGVADSGIEGLAAIDRLRPDLVLMDVRMPAMDGIECTRRIKLRYPDMLVLILTTYNEEAYIIDGLAHGANGYLLKGLDFALLVSTIRSTLRGQYVLPAEVAAKLSAYLMNNKPGLQELNALPAFITERHTLTNREKDILLLLGNRLSVREIAAELNIGEGTTKNYLTIIYEKLNVANRYEAIDLVRNGR
ncbi:response regulator transcription factor [Cohnella fermenti]|uniref:response regulator transcription factor n=1 Tax=Cohnella fermenti TaxID=2565925 RepID=UPI001454C312|nr:response regulator transcription factor [Cohnella fermenti]